MPNSALWSSRSGRCRGKSATCCLAREPCSLACQSAPDFKIISHVCMEDNASNPLRLPVRQAAALASAVADRDGRARLERQSSTRPCPRRMNELRARHGVPSEQRMEHSVSNGVEFHAKPSRRLANTWHYWCCDRHGTAAEHRIATRRTWCPHQWHTCVLGSGRHWHRECADGDALASTQGRHVDCAAATLDCVYLTFAHKTSSLPSAR